MQFYTEVQYLKERKKARQLVVTVLRPQVVLCLWGYIQWLLKHLLECRGFIVQMENYKLCFKCLIL